MSDYSDIVHKLKSEIYARGPVATGVNAEPLVEYTGGRVDDTKVSFYVLVELIKKSMTNILSLLSIVLADDGESRSQHCGLGDRSREWKCLLDRPQ